MSNGRKNSGFNGAAASAVLFIIVGAFALTGISAASSAAGRDGLAETERSVRRAAVECYALEGAYPPDLEYLEEHYGIRVDDEKYLVHYDAPGGNIMPNIIVRVKQ